MAKKEQCFTQKNKMSNENAGGSRQKFCVKN